MEENLGDIIKLKDIDFYYNKGLQNELRALTKINLEIKRGEFVSFFGSSGCGKSTMLYMISGIDKPDNGQVFFNGHDMSKFSAKEIAVYRQMGMGLIFQNFNLIPSLTVIDNVALPMTFLGLTGTKRKERAQEILEYLNIKNLANRFPYELSGGQQQRVGIARALANDPPLILADEPTGNLDSTNAVKTMELLKELSTKHGKTVILVTHEAWCLKYVDNIFYMKDGMITKTEKVKAQDLQGIEEGKGIEEKIKQAHPMANNVQMVAGYFSTFFLRGYSQEETKRAQIAIAKRVSNEFNYNQLFEELDKPFDLGGVGLWKQKARSIADMIEDTMKESQEIAYIHQKLEKHPNSTLEQEIKNIRLWLMEIYHGTMSPFMSDSFDECLQERVRNIITNDNFIKVMTTPKQKGGLGFSTPTALKISDRLEIILSAAYAPAPPSLANN